MSEKEKLNPNIPLVKRLENMLDRLETPYPDEDQELTSLASILVEFELPFFPPNQGPPSLEELTEFLGQINKIPRWKKAALLAYDWRDYQSLFDTSEPNNELFQNLFVLFVLLFILIFRSLCFIGNTAHAFRKSYKRYSRGKQLIALLEGELAAVQTTLASEKISDTEKEKSIEEDTEERKRFKDLLG